jgi:hypothetical protein
MTGDAKDWRFPAVCPRCLNKAGNPVRVAAHREQFVEIWVGCEGCKHEWKLTADAPPLLLKRKPDRRAPSG